MATRALIGGDTMTVDPSITDDPNAGGQDGGTSVDTGTQPDSTAGRTYSEAEVRSYVDSQMANARRAWEYESGRKLERERQTWTRQSATPQASTTDPWAAFDPTVKSALQQVFQAELEARTKPLADQLATFKQAQEDLAFASNEAQIAAKYPDYQKNRTAILEFAVANGIADVDHAYRSWKYDEFSKIDLNKVRNDAVAAHLKKKTAQSVNTPAVEGRGGGTPSTKQTFKSREEMDDAALELIRQMSNE